MGTGIVTIQTALRYAAFAALFPFSFLLWRLSSPHIPVIGDIAIILVCSLALFFLLLVRLVLAQSFWLSLWLFLSPVLVGSVFLIPTVPIFPTLPVFFAVCSVLAVWGKHRFYGLLHNSRLHQARFARLDEAAHLFSHSLPSDGLLLGTHMYSGQIVSVRSHPTRRELGNMLVVAPTRGGKGLLATSQLLTWKHSVVVNDVKGELFTATAGYRSTRGTVYVLDPIRGVGHRFDPLHGKQTEDQFTSAATHLLFEAEEKERIFTQQATVMLTQMFLASRIEGIAPFPYARFLIRLGFPFAAQHLNQIDPVLATQFLDANFADADLNSRYLRSCWGTLTARLRPLLTETVVRCLMQSDFTPQEIMCSDTPVTVYIRWKEQDLLALSPLVRLLWGSLIYELSAVYDERGGNGCKPVLLLIDEAGKTAIPALSEHAATVAGRGIILAMFVQDLSQLETIYGTSRAQTLRANTDTQLYYPPIDLSTAEYLERRLGNQSAFAHSTTSRTGTDDSIGETERPIPLLTAQDIIYQHDTDVIGFHRHVRPLRMKRMDWRDHALLRGRQAIPAPQLPHVPHLTALPAVAATPRRSEPFPKHGYIDPDMAPPATSKQTKEHVN